MMWRNHAQTKQDIINKQKKKSVASWKWFKGRPKWVLGLRFMNMNEWKTRKTQRLDAKSASTGRGEETWKARGKNRPNDNTSISLRAGPNFSWSFGPHITSYQPKIKAQAHSPFRPVHGSVNCKMCIIVLACGIPYSQKWWKKL